MGQCGISLVPALGGKFVELRAGEAYDVRVRAPNRKIVLKTNDDPNKNSCIGCRSKSVSVASEIDARTFRLQRDFRLGPSFWCHCCRPYLGEFALECILLRALEISVENRSPPSFLDGPASLDR